MVGHNTAQGMDVRTDAEHYGKPEGLSPAHHANEVQVGAVEELSHLCCKCLQVHRTALLLHLYDWQISGVYSAQY